MSTYEIKKADLESLEVVATGYKAVNYDNSTKQSFCYGEKGESLVGKVFKVDGNISECHWGLHFSKDPPMYSISMSRLDITNILK
jgi:hypothetical protein